MKKSRFYLAVLLVLVVGFIPLMAFINLKQQVSSMEAELQMLKGGHGFTQQKNQIESIQADVKMLQNDQAMINYNQRQLIKDVTNLLDIIWQVDTFTQKEG